MIFPIILLLASLAGMIAALAVPALSGILLVAGPGLLFAVLLLLRALVVQRREMRRRPGNLVVIDGSNAMYWKDDTPRLGTLIEIVDRLYALGFTPAVVFDANAGYLLAGGHRNDAGMARLLGLPKNRIMVVPKGTPADPVILEAAHSLGARILSNDRYRDWAEAHPELRAPGYVIRGGYRRGRLWLDVDQSAGECQSVDGR